MAITFFFLSFVLSLVSLAHGALCQEALPPAPQTRDPGATWPHPTLQLRDRVQKLQTTPNSRWRWQAVCRDAAPGTAPGSANPSAHSLRELHSLPFP